MNIDEINEVFDDVDAKIAQKYKCNDIHRDYDMEQAVDAILERKSAKDVRNIFDIKDEYINNEYKSWKREMESLNNEDRCAIHSAVFSRILMGDWDNAEMLTPKQKVFYHAGIRLFVMKEQNEEKRNSSCGYNY